MNVTRVFVALGTDRPEPLAILGRALEAIEAAGAAVVQAARVVRGPYLGPDQRPDPAHPPIHNTVVEVRTARRPEDLLGRLAQVERALGRGPGAAARVLDLDLLAYGAERRSGGPLALPHPRAFERAFVLGPWEEIAPEARVAAAPGAPARRLVEHRAALLARAPERFACLAAGPAPPLPARRGTVRRLADRAALSAWRATQAGVVGLVPTLGALHEGHAALLRRARAECDAVLATIFVNPLQFGAGEDYARYPRTLADDVARLEAAGADAVYLPEPADLYPPGFSTFVVPEGFERYEGARRPGHFRGVATVVAKLWLRARPGRVYFGCKDAQQLALVRRLRADLDLEGEVVACATVREADGLARSSRNRYLDAAERARAAALPRALDGVAARAAAGEAAAEGLCAPAHAELAGAGLEVEYLALVDAETCAPLARLDAPALVLAAARAGATRLLDNRWVARPPAGGEAA